MASPRELLEAVRDKGVAAGHFRGLLYVLVARRVSTTDGEAVSAGMTWRDLSALLKKVRWDREAVRELGIDPAELPPRDREKYWYLAIGRAGLSSPEASQDADALTAPLRELGYVVA